MAGTGAVGLRRTKDSAMASRMKDEKQERTSMRCPVCTGIVAIASFYGHISTLCKGGKRVEEDAA